MTESMDDLSQHSHGIIFGAASNTSQRSPRFIRTSPTMAGSCELTLCTVQCHALPPTHFPCSNPANHQSPGSADEARHRASTSLPRKRSITPRPFSQPPD